MELNYLRYFYEVARSGSFTEAARRLRISQSALSKSVALLEHREGIKLLHRSKKGVTLTEVGREVFAQSERLFSLVGEIEATCKGRSEVCEGPLTFGASDHVVNYLLLPELKKFQAHHPKVRPRIMAGTPNDTVQLLLSREIDFGLFFTRVNTPSIKYEVLTEFEMVAVCQARLLPSGESRNLKTLLQKPGLISSIQNQYQSAALIKQGGKETRLTCEVSSQESQKRFCLLGGGIAYLARFMVEKELSSGQLEELPVKKKERVQLSLATHRERELPFAARTFLDHLRANLP